MQTQNLETTIYLVEIDKGFEKNFYAALMNNSMIAYGISKKPQRYLMEPIEMLGGGIYKLH